MRNIVMAAAVLVAVCAASPVTAGPYSLGAGDTDNAFDPAVPGFVGPDGDGKCPTKKRPDNYVNPEFLGWASGYLNYAPADSWWSGDWCFPAKALGPVTGDYVDIVSLGDLADPANPPDDPMTGLPVNPNDPNDDFAFVGIDNPGEITLTFDTPIRNGAEADFAVFENGFYSEWETGEGAVVGEIFAELGYVQVSSDGVNWLQFASDSLTPAPAPSEDGYGQLTIDPTNVYNLVGKHANAYGVSWGTPFDLDEFADHPDVAAGLVDLQRINYVKIVDVPGSGDFDDSDGDPIYDAWVTWGSGGLDLEALGVLNEMPDFDGDGDVDGDDFDILCDNLGSADPRYDLDGDGDADADDLGYMVNNCLQWDNGAGSGYGTAAGDFNLDGAIDTTDLTILAANFGLDVGWTGGNANCDNVVDTTDLAILATNFGFVAAGTPVPEPAAIGLLGLGWLALARRRKA